MDEHLGKDLMVIPNLVAHDASEVDLITRRTRARVLAPGTGSEAYDLRVFSGRENLAQALLLRLLTPRSSLSSLGHASYGSRLHELIGQRKTEALRNLCRAYILEVVAQEPRVDDTAIALDFDPEAETFSSFVFTLEVQPRPNGDPLGLSLEIEI